MASHRHRQAGAGGGQHGEPSLSRAFRGDRVRAVHSTRRGRGLRRGPQAALSDGAGAFFRELLPAFETSSGHRVAAQYGPAGAIAERIRKGEAVDVAVVTVAQSETLIREGKAAAASRVEIGKVGVGAYVAKGAARPDIASADAFTRALRAAKSIGHTDPASGGASGIYLASLFERLGLAAELRPKIRLFPGGPSISPPSPRATSSYAFGQISEIVNRPNVEFVGPLPAEYQNYTRFAAFVAAGTGNGEAAALVRHLAAPAAKAAMRAKGFEP
ncbi:MAG: substrate-binding domain-containing protein [Alphaproteobacteria bacterium]